MFLSRDMAEKMIYEMSKIITYDMNIMNGEGLIIASTDARRVGDFHEGAYLLLKQRLPELLVFRDGEYKGCKKGINLPIILEHDIIGVIGMTGEVKEILHYGKIIKKMSEILLMDYMYYYKRNLDVKSRSYFISEWIHDRFGRDSASFLAQLSDFRFDPAGTYVVAIMKSIQAAMIDSGLMEDVEKFIFRRFNREQIIVGSEGNFYILIANNLTMESIKDIIGKKIKETEEMYKIKLCCAVGDVHTGYAGVPASYKEAYEIMNLTEFEKKEGGGLFVYHERLFDLILAKIPMPLYANYQDRIFRQCSKEETENFCRFILIYVQCNGSINRMAEETFTHKNTVQYRIGKIREKTGLDLRHTKDMIQLYLAAAM